MGSKIKKTIQEIELRSLGVGVLVIAIALVVASQIQLPGSSAWSPVPTGTGMINPTPWNDIQPVLGEEFRITSDGGELPDIYGDNVVFVKDGAILVKNIKDGWELTVSKDPAWKWEPAIYQDKIVWSDNRNRTPVHSNDIYMFDMTTGIETRISGDLPDYDINRQPDIYGNKIVWNSYQGDICRLYMHNIDTGATSIISSPEAKPYYPIIYGNKIVWGDTRNPWPDYSINMYNITTGIESVIWDDADFLGGATIYGDTIAWMNEPHSALVHNIYSYNISTQVRTQITNVDDYDYDSHPAIYENKLVWWHTTPLNFPNTWEISIYMHDFNQPIGVNHKVVDIPAIGDVLDMEGTLRIYDKTIVWADKRDVQHDGKINVFGFKLF